MDAKTDAHIIESFPKALSEGWIQPFYQPVIRSITGKLCSFEALARWIDPQLGMIGPGSFIPVLEQANMIHLLDLAIIRQVCARIRLSIDRGETPVPVSINLSRLDFELCDIFSEVTQTVRDHRVPRDFLHIEVTESLMAERGDIMGAAIDRFRAAGFQVWMDDFGSGYSSLNVLKDYSFDELKLDMKFLSSFDDRSRRITTSVIQMAKQIGLHTLTEGVETEEQFTFLRDIGCEKIQGYFFGKPMPYDEAMEHLASRGIEIERPAEHHYFDDIGLVDLLSAVPFVTHRERAQGLTARQLNSIPLAMAEVRKDSFSIFFFNEAFEQTVTGIGQVSNVFAPEMLGQPQPYTRLPSRINRLIDSLRTGKEGRIYFISNEEYYEVQAKRVAQMRDTYCVLFRMSNLSKAAELEKTTRLDESLRQVYSLYERVTLIDVGADYIMTLYAGTQEDLIPTRANLGKLNMQYCETWIHPEDQKEYRAYSDRSTMERRLLSSGNDAVTELFRTRVGHGAYEWKEYTLLRLQKDQYVELIRNVHDEVLELAKRASRLPLGFAGARETADALEASVWRTLVNSDVINLFWKDGDRRFLGASRGFLDYYGFASVDDIRGKNDEDLGWHVQPGHYRNDELDVINEGITTYFEPGHCMRGGENRDILASKTPLYDPNGGICGLVGYFLDKGAMMANDVRGDETSRRDLLTGLLNSRGIHEEARIFRDEYFLRGTDFTRISVSIDEIGTINRQYGYDFGDKAIVAFGSALRQSFAQTAAIGRCSGHQLAVLCQIHEPGEEAELRARVKRAAERVKQVDGMDMTLYVSVGSCRFSETETLEEQTKKAEVRQLADHDEHLSVTSRQTRASEIFHLYDNLPIAYAVYRVVMGDDNTVSDAILFYVNHRFEERYGLKAAQLLGKGTRELFDFLDDDWYETARRAAFEGEIVTKRFVYEPTGETYYMTASQVIHSGYCCFTYQEIDV